MCMIDGYCVWAKEGLIETTIYTHLSSLEIYDVNSTYGDDGKQCLRT